MEKQKGLNLSVIISLVAVLVSFLSLWVSIQGQQSTQAYNRMSVRPMLAFEVIYAPSAAPQPNIGLYLSNLGTGIALVHSATYYVDDKPTTPTQAVRTLGLLDRPDFPMSFSATIPDAIPPGRTLLLLGTDKEQLTTERRDTLAAAISHLKIHIDYKSLYDEPFETDFSGVSSNPIKPTQ